jgi:hypothetical protein
MDRSIVLVLILFLTVSSLILVKPSLEQTKPSVPEFSLELINDSNDVVTQAGYHVESRTIELTIKNQPLAFQYYTNSKWTSGFFYNIRIKQHNSENWSELYQALDGYQPASEFAYTTITFQGNYSSEQGLNFTSDTITKTFPPGAQVDFQVQAMVGQVSRALNPNSTSTLDGYPWVFTGETSDWSSTQTLTILDTSTRSPNPIQTQSPSSSLVPSPSIPEFTYLISSILLVVGATSLLVLKKRRNL